MPTPVNFELAKLLKQKGFGMSNENYIQLPRFYEEDGNYIEYKVHVSRKYNPQRGHLGADTIEDFKAHLVMMDNSLDDIYLAPTFAEVIMWLYEKHGIWVYTSQNSKGMFQWSLDYNATGDKGMLEFNSPNEAHEAGIKYTLENLL